MLLHSMKRFWLLNGSLLCCLLASAQPTSAQIVPDNTLSNNSVVPANCTNCDITGGTTVGTNLFHSFEQFSVPINGAANFNNAANIQNIFSRVTGQSISNIEGLIRANDAANLFLINPNGIIFGPEASLNIGGSFIATTASRIRFADGREFQAQASQTNPLLSITIPIGLVFGQSPGSIINQAASFNNVDSAGLPVGLQIPAGKTLALVGGEIAFEGGVITSPGGRLEVGSVAGNNLVRLIPNEQGWTLGYEGIQNFQDINLSQVAFIGASDAQGANIQIQGRRVTLTGGSQIGFLAGSGAQAGDVIVRATELVNLVGVDGDVPSSLFNQVEADATGEGRTLTVETERLILQDGAAISTSTFGAGRGADLNISATKSVELTGNSQDDALFPSIILALVEVPEATGAGGNLTVNTGKLILRDGAQLTAATFGQGRAGNLIVKASDSIELTGTQPNSTQPSGLFAQVELGATGDGGNLSVETQRLTVTGGAQISSSGRSGGKGGSVSINASDAILLSGASPLATLLVGRSGIFVSAEPGATRDAGQLEVKTGNLTVENNALISADNFGPATGGNATFNVRQLLVSNGGEIRARSFAAGSGGNIIVNATDSVEVIGSGSIGGQTFPSALTTSAASSGKAGNLIINSDRLSVLDGAELTVSSEGSGQAGNLEVTARRVLLDNQSKVIAETASGDGGNITLKLSEVLLLRRNSLISTTAGTALEGGNGGIINITAPFILAIPSENSDIRANAFTGNGGQVNITTQGIFGIQPRLVETPESDITASSTSGGVNGVININNPDVDPSQGLGILPEGVVDVSELIAQGCDAESQLSTSQFTVTGRGGLPPSPDDSNSGDAVWSDTRVTVAAKPPSRSETIAAKPLKTFSSLPLVPASGWVFNNKGEVTLVAHVPNATLSTLGINSTACRSR
jgi:filamentous hemagglutinin family protein